MVPDYCKYWPSKTGSVSISSSRCHEPKTHQADDYRRNLLGVVLGAYAALGIVEKFRNGPGRDANRYEQQCGILLGLMLVADLMAIYFFWNYRMRRPSL
jgi:hypothetical protein